MITFSKMQSRKGSTRRFWNVEKCGIPFCQIKEAMNFVSAL